MGGWKVLLLIMARTSTMLTTAARTRASLLFLVAVHVCLHFPASAYRPPLFLLPSRARVRKTSPWVTRSSVHTYSTQPLLLPNPMVLEEFNEAEIVDHLEHDYMEDLALLAIKFGTMIGAIEDIEEVHVSELDGDHMQLDVVYCERNEQTCVAVAVPIVFPYRCQNENNVIDAIHQLEEMDDLERSSEVTIIQKPIPAEMMETIARICVVMNRDFQDELVSFVQAFGGADADRPTGKCEMVSLTPNGFLVRAELFPEKPVTVSFPSECLSAQDFQRQILDVSRQAMMIV